MATAREARAERLNERLRGAQRVNVGDDSFNLDIADLGIPPAPSSSPAKNHNVNTRAPTTVQNEPRPSARRPPQKQTPYDLPDTSKESGAQRSDATSDVRPESAPDGTSRTSRSPASPESSHAGLDAPPEPRSLMARSEPDADDPGSVPPPSDLPTTRPDTTAVAIDEIEESPINAPGSGQRKRVESGRVLPSSASLQGTLQSDDNAPMSSSPLTRKSKRSDAATSVRTVRSIRQTLSRSPAGGEDELSPDRPRSRAVVDDEIVDRGTLTANKELVQEESGDDEEAQEVDETEAAKTIGRKRPRSSLRGSSPQLGSDDREDEPPPKRGRGRPSKSPATQKQGAPKTKTKPRGRPSGPKASEKAKTKDKPQASLKKRRGSDEGSVGNAAIELTVQRFVHHKKRGGDDGDDTDPLQLDIPFANRTGESAVDVFSQVCDEVIANTLERFQEMADTATDTAKKKEFRIKARAVEAYREVLNSRLLQHTIHLDHWHSLRKRLRHAQKEKLELREEIIRLKAEREQVALRMDAVRIKHEADTKESTFLLNTSSTMRDIDLAVAQGREAPELSAKAQKEAELANLELAVAQISDLASSAGSTGGLLSQIRDFNSFLERAAVALESR